MSDKTNAIYHERNQLVAALSKIFPSWISYHEGEDWDSLEGKEFTYLENEDYEN